MLGRNAIGQRFRCALQGAVAKMEDVIEAIKNLLVVGDDDDRRLLFGGDALEQVHDDPGALRVERRRRLVRQNDPRVVGKCASDRHPLRLAAGQLGRKGVPAMTNFQVVKQLNSAAAGLLGRKAGQMQHHRDILGAGQERQQVVILKDEADLFRRSRRRFARSHWPS